MNVFPEFVVEARGTQMEQTQLLLDLPNEVTEIILFLLDTPHLLRMRLISKGFDNLICLSLFW